LKPVITFTRVKLNKKKTLGLAVALVVLATLTGGYFLGRFSLMQGQQGQQQNESSEGENYYDLLSTATWAIQTDGTWYWAMNQNGSNCFKSLVCTDVWNSVLSLPDCGTIVIGTGRQFFTSTVIVPENVQIVGVNQRACAIQRTGNFPIFALNTTEGKYNMHQGYNTIRNLYLDGGGYSAPLLYCSQLKVSYLTELTLSNFVGDGVVFNGSDPNHSFSFWNHISYITIENVTGTCHGSVFLFTGSSWDYDVSNIQGYYGGNSQAPVGFTILGGGSCSFTNVFLTRFRNLFNFKSSQLFIYGVHLNDCFANNAQEEGIIINAQQYDIWNIHVSYSKFDGSKNSNLPLIRLRAENDHSIYGCSFDHNCYPLGNYNPSITNALYSYAIEETSSKGGKIWNNTFSFNSFPAGSKGIYLLTSEDYEGVVHDAYYIP
jgi:hypothetical protein